MRERIKNIRCEKIKIFAAEIFLLLFFYIFTNFRG